MTNAAKQRRISGLVVVLIVLLLVPVGCTATVTLMNNSVAKGVVNRGDTRDRRLRFLVTSAAHQRRVDHGRRCAVRVVVPTFLLVGS